MDPEDRSIRRSLYRNMRFVIDGVRNSIDGWQLHEMVCRAFIYVPSVVAFYGSSGALRDEANELGSVLLQKGDKDLPDIQNGGQRQFRTIIDELDRAADEYCRSRSRNAARHSSPPSVSSKSNTVLTTPTERSSNPRS